MSPVEFPASSAGKVSESAVTSASSKPRGGGRLLVRVVIGALLAVAVTEGVAVLRMTIMSQRLWSELQKGEREGIDITRERIDAVVGRSPDRTFTVVKSVGEEKYDAYRFWGLLKRRELYVHYGVQGIRSPQEAIEVLVDLPDGVSKTQ